MVSLKLDNVSSNLNVYSPSSSKLLHRTLDSRLPLEVVSTPYAANGVARMVPKGVEREPGVSHGEPISVGIICDSWPSWVFGFLHKSFDVRWILVKNAFWIDALTSCYPFLDFVLWDDACRLECPQVLALSDGIDAYVPHFLDAQIIICDWEQKIAGQFRRLKRWRSRVIRTTHSYCGGVSDLTVVMKCFINPVVFQFFDFNPRSLVEPCPGSSLNSILDIKLQGSKLLTRPELPTLEEPCVLKVGEPSIYHYRGLYPCGIRDPEFYIPCVFAANRWVRRHLQTFELLRVYDIPIQVEKTLSHRQQQLLLQVLKVPCKCSTAVAHSLFLASPPTRSEGASLASNGGGDILSSPLPVGWDNNATHDRDERAAKSDDARVPVELWENHLAKQLGKNCLSVTEQCALNSIRKASLRVWQKSIMPCFIGWLRCKKCHNEMLRKRFKGCYIYDNYIIEQHSKYCEETAAAPIQSLIEWNGSRYIWNTRVNGRANYSRYWNLVFAGGNSKERKDIEESIAGFLEGLYKAYECKEWSWDGGSRTFFWRWGEHWKSSRDGAEVHVYKDKLPSCKEKQSVPKDSAIRDKVVEKISNVRSKGYIQKGYVKSLTSFFAVPKSDDDIRMVYNGTSSGLNDAVWASWFALPTVDTHLRSTLPNTFMCDIDLSEMFLNFMLDKELRAYAGVDLSKLFQEEVEKGGTLWECWVRMLMGFKPSPYLTTRDMRRIEEFLLGDKANADNVFRWHKVVFNLPGSKDYDPSMPRVYRVRIEGTIAGDLFIYIDDLRVTCPSSTECWLGAHQVCCRLTWLGLQDAPRKRSEVSTTPRAWAGTIVHTDNQTVSVLISQKKWQKAKKWIDWLEACLSVGNKLNHKELERCRGFLIYVSRTYRSMKPYLRGLHMTIENWRDNRDEEGWKILKAFDDDDNISSLENHIKKLASSPSEFVEGVPRLSNDVQVMKKLLSPSAPPKVRRRRSKLGKAYYGLGDASGAGFGYAVDIDGTLYDEYGEWKAAISEQSSNYRELRNLKNAVERLAKAKLLEDSELYLFTDNFVAERAYYNGGSTQSKHLDQLVFELWNLQMHYDFDLYVYHIAGTRMIESGVDGLSRGDKGEGVARGIPVLNFIPTHLTPFERSTSLESWIYSWWNDKENSLGKLYKLSPEEWFSDYNKKGSFLWNVAPTAGEAAVEQLCAHVHAQPYANHIFVIPRLCTSHWRKQLLKVCDCVVTVQVGSCFWPSDMHEPLILGLYFSLLPTHHRFAPWRLKYTQWLENQRCKMQEMQSRGEPLDGNLLRKLFSQARELPTMRKELARKMLSPKTK